MQRMAVTAVLLTVLLAGCSTTAPATSSSATTALATASSAMTESAAGNADSSGGDIDLSGGEPSAYDEMQKEAETESKSTRAGKKCDIRFIYHNDFYGYNLEATWSDVMIKKSNTNLGTEVYGLELLLDDTARMFDDLDTDSTGDINQNEWGEIEPDFPFKEYDIDKNGKIDSLEFTGFSQMLGGFDIYPTGFTIAQPTMEGYALELNNEEGPVSIKILRASSAGFTGGYGYYFPAGTVFVELASDFRIFMPAAGDMDVTSAFDYPLLNMYVDDAKEVKDSYSHGAMGFTSVVDTETFNGIFSGKRFSLQYEAYYDGKVVGTYDLTITPK